MGTPKTGNPSSIVELEATELLLWQTRQDSQGAMCSRHTRYVPTKLKLAERSASPQPHSVKQASFDTTTRRGLVCRRGPFVVESSRVLR